MKLAKDMFDFEKYDYRWGYPTIADEILGSDGWVTPDLASANRTLLRTPKPPPRYILLNEGEKRQPGDQLLRQRLLDGQYELLWSAPLKPDDYTEVRTGEIWRRKVQE